MKHIVEAFGTLLALLLNVFVCISVANVGGAVTEAKEFKAAAVAELENSNFNPNVVDACIRQAQDAGYVLQVTNCSFDEDNDIQMAEVILTYRYEIPILGISEIMTTRGIAR